MNRRRVVPGLIAMLVFGACGGDGGGQAAQGGRCAAAPDTLTIASTYSPDLDVSLSQFECNATGLHWKVLAEGDGPVAADGDMARVHYTVRLPDGTTVDSSIPRGEPYAFVLGTGSVIRGWDVGVAGMRVGGRRILVVPPHLAYGSPGRGAIPPDATLVFEVELMEVVKPGG
jgi:peptidylprolyl isomerase